MKKSITCQARKFEYIAEGKVKQISVVDVIQKFVELQRWTQGPAGGPQIILRMRVYRSIKHHLKDIGDLVKQSLNRNHYVKAFINTDADIQEIENEINKMITLQWIIYPEEIGSDDYFLDTNGVWH